MPNIAAVFFDLDNTLYDHRRAAREALAEIYRRYDVARAGAGVDEFVHEANRLSSVFHSRSEFVP